MDPFDYDLVTIPDSRWWRLKSTAVYYWLRLKDKIRKPKPYRIGQ